MQNVADKAKADSLLHVLNYPPQITRRHFEKKYDNAVWLYYASNFHSNKVSCYCRGNPGKIYLDTTIISFYPKLMRVDDNNGDTIEIWLALGNLSDTLTCLSMQEEAYSLFGFLRESDSIIYRCSGDVGLWKNFHGDLWNKSDSLEKLKAIEEGMKERKLKFKYDRNLPIFSRSDGNYPIDEQNELFIQYLKAHKKQISPPLMRLCKERKIF